jgi:LemA protein
METILVGLFVVAAMVVIWIISTINRFARLRNLSNESWSNVDVALKRRHDLIPNLVAVVKGYATHEAEVLARVTEARTKALEQVQSLRQVADHERDLGSAVHQLVMRIEAYPDLKASAQFLSLQKELANTEDRIAAARRFYNSNVRELRIMTESFPSSLLAGDSRLPEFFELDAGEGAMPQVSLRP